MVDDDVSKIYGMFKCPQCGRQDDVVTITPDSGENSISWCTCGVVFVQNANRSDVNKVIYNF